MNETIFNPRRPTSPGRPCFGQFSDRSGRPETEKVGLRGFCDRLANLAILAAIILASAFFATPATADTPTTMYIFPAGGQSGTTVKFRVGGLYLHEACPFEMLGKGVAASSKIEETKTTWFEGPVIPLGDSQQQEDYPKDMAGSVNIASDAVPGPRAWRVWTAQGAVPSRPFIVGTLPEVVEDEIDGDPIPVKVTLPITINGRTFPREDVDDWMFEAKAGETITCSVVTTRLGSPFDARVEIRDADGRRLAESAESAPPGSDALMRFTAPVDGIYTARIHDMKYGGLQHYVYRLTITAGPTVDRVYPLGGRRGTTTRFELSGSNLPAGPVEIPLPADGPLRFVTSFGPADRSSNLFALALDDLPEVLEQEPNDEPAQVQPVAVPAILNGRIGKPGDVDCWAVRAAKDQTLEFDLQAARHGSPVDSVIVLSDASGKELARADDIAPIQTDSFLKFTFKEEGTYFVRVEERLASRGGAAFAYRLRVAPPPAPDFRLHLPIDAVSVNRGGDGKFKLRVERLGSFAEVINLEFAGLPQGITVNKADIPANAAEFEVVLKGDAAAPIAARTVAVKGVAMSGGQRLERTATFVSPAMASPEGDSLLVAACLPTPYKVKGTYEIKYAQRGRTFVRHFAVQRAGFDGPLRVRMADKQARHLQGVTGPTIDLAAGVSEFDYPVFLPPWMEIGRTSRAVIMVSGEVAEADGSRHKVSFTSLEQGEQIVALVDPGQLSVEVDRRSIREAPGESAALAVEVGRGQGVNVPVRVELVIPAHIRGISAEPVTLPANKTTGALTIKFTGEHPGPFNMPLLVRATAMKSENDPIVAEVKIEVVPAK